MILEDPIVIEDTNDTVDTANNTADHNRPI